MRGLNLFQRRREWRKPRGHDDDRTVIDVNVRDADGRVEFQRVGYSSAEDFTLQLSVSERNFLGRGQRLRLVTWVISNQGAALQHIGFTGPYFLNRDVSAGFEPVRYTVRILDFQSGLTLRRKWVRMYRWGFLCLRTVALSLFASTL